MARLPLLTLPGYPHPVIDSVERLAQIKYLKAEGQAGEQLIEQIDYSYDAAGRRTSKTSLNNNGIGYVEGNPVSYADPLGLWSVTVGAYLGVGGQMTFGNDGGNGFMTARFGFGLGGGASYNPTGGIPGPVPQHPSSGGVVLSCSAKANFNAGPLSSSLEKGVARNYSNAESAVYGGASASGRDRFSGLGASGSFGGQITIYSGKK